MLFVKILIITFFVLLAILIVLGIHSLFEMNRDNKTVRRYNAKMNKLRKERVLQEKENQRRIRGETKDAPLYAAGDEKDRINRQSYYELHSDEIDTADIFIIKLGAVVVVCIIIVAFIGI